MVNVRSLVEGAGSARRSRTRSPCRATPNVPAGPGVELGRRRPACTALPFSETRDIVDRLALAERNVAVAAVNSPSNATRDLLLDPSAAVRPHADVDDAPREGEGPRLGRAGEGERDERRSGERALRAYAPGGHSAPSAGAAGRRLRRTASPDGGPWREVDLRHLALAGVLDLEELALRKPKSPRGDTRERLDRVVVRQHRVVVDLARDRDPVLGLDSSPAAGGSSRRPSAPDTPRRPRTAGRAPGRGSPRPAPLAAGPCAPLRRGARRGHRLERATLVSRVALDRLDQVRDQILAALELHLDLRPGVVDAVAELDEAVVERDQQTDEQHDDREDHHQTQTMRASYG